MVFRGHSGLDDMASAEGHRMQGPEHDMALFSASHVGSPRFRRGVPLFKKHVLHVFPQKVNLHMQMLMFQFFKFTIIRAGSLTVRHKLFLFMLWPLLVFYDSLVYSTSADTDVVEMYHMPW